MRHTGSRGANAALLFATLLLTACTIRSMSADEHAGHSLNASAPVFRGEPSAQQSALPAGDTEAMARLSSSRRHGEWVVIPAGKNPVTGANDSTRAWVVFPERSDKAPVVIVIHEIYGLSPWIRGVADQLAADGFIAVAPDLITMKDIPGNPVDGPDPQRASAVIRSLTDEELHRQLDAVAKYAMALPAAMQKYGVVGYCWGGTASFKRALQSPNLSAAVVYYGSTPDGSFTGIAAPVLGLYGGNDNRVNATIPRADSVMKANRKSYEYHVFDGAGHGFLRQQSAPANLEATRKAWPLTVQFFKKHLEGR